MPHLFPREGADLGALLVEPSHALQIRAILVLQIRTDEQRVLEVTVDKIQQSEHWNDIVYAELRSMR